MTDDVPPVEKPEGTPPEGSDLVEKPLVAKPEAAKPAGKPQAKPDAKSEGAKVELKAEEAPKLSTQNIAKLLFRAQQDEPRATPQMTKFFRGLILAQSYIIALLVVLTLLTSTVFAPKTIYHLVILDKEGVPTKLYQRGNPPTPVPGQYFYPPYLLQALDEPNLTHTAILNMTMNVVTEVLTFGFNNADEKLLDARHLFTTEAWNYFGKAYLQQGRLDTIKRNQQVLTAIATAGAVVVSEGMVDDVDRWVVQVPIVTTYQAGKEVSHKRSVLQLTLVRASTLEHPEGVAIAGWEELAAGLGVRQGWGGE